MQQGNNLQQTQPSTFTYYAWVIWFIAALFYCAEFFQRVAPGIIAKSLSFSFNLHPATLGFIISLYYAAYAITQIPVGVILDRYGSRLPLGIACALVACGTLAFATTSSVEVLAIARIIVGIGSAFAFVGCLKIASIWFPNRYFPIVVGLTNTLGVIGALVGQEPLSYMVLHWGWQQSLIYSAIAGLIISALLFIFIRNHASQKSGRVKRSHVDLKSSIWHIICTPQSWLIGIYAGLMVAPIISLAELWSIPFLEKIHHLTPALASQANEMIFVGIAIGGPVNGWISGLFNCRKPVLMIGNILALALLLVFIYVQHAMPMYALDTLLFFYGFFTSSMLIAFSANTEMHRPAISGTVVAFTNMMIMIIGAIFQPLIGRILDLFMVSSNIAAYSTRDFQLALSTLPIALFVNLILLQFMKETRCKNITCNEEVKAPF